MENEKANLSFHIVAINLPSFVLVTPLALGQEPASLFPMSVETSMPDLSKPQHTLKGRRLAVRLRFSVSAKSQKNEDGDDNNEPSLAIEAVYDVVANASRTPDEKEIKRFIKSEAHDLAFGLFRSKVMQATGEAGFPVLTINPRPTQSKSTKPSKNEADGNQ